MTTRWSWRRTGGVGDPRRAGFLERVVAARHTANPPRSRANPPLGRSNPPVPGTNPPLARSNPPVLRPVWHHGALCGRAVFLASAPFFIGSSLAASFFDPSWTKVDAVPVVDRGLRDCRAGDVGARLEQMRGKAVPLAAIGAAVAAVQLPPPNSIHPAEALAPLQGSFRHSAAALSPRSPRRGRRWISPIQWTSNDAAIFAFISLMSFGSSSMGSRRSDPERGNSVVGGGAVPRSPALPSLPVTFSMEGAHLVC